MGQHDRPDQRVGDRQHGVGDGVAGAVDDLHTINIEKVVTIINNILGISVANFSMRILILYDPRYSGRCNIQNIDFYLNLRQS